MRRLQLQKLVPTSGKLGLISLLYLLSFANISSAHPVTFVDGNALMFWQQRDRTEAQGNYTLSRKLAIGVSSARIRYRNDSANFAWFQVYKLAKRWNLKAAQGNIYLSGGLGGREFETDWRLAGFGAFQADYETRFFFTELRYDSLLSGQGINFNRLRYRIGGSPMKVPADEIQGWLLANVEFNPDMGREFNFGPVVRFFTQEVFVEAGLNNNLDPSFHLMVHF